MEGHLIEEDIWIDDFLGEDIPIEMEGLLGVRISWRRPPEGRGPPDGGGPLEIGGPPGPPGG